MKNFDIFIFIDPENIFYNNSTFSLEELTDKINDLNLRKIILVISDWNIFKLDFDIKLKKFSEAKNAAENHFLYLNPDTSYNPKFFNIQLRKNEDGYRATVYYISKEAEEFVDIFLNGKFKNKVLHILPLFEIYKNYEKKYIFNNYITIILENSILNFHKKDVDSFKNFLSEEEISNLKEVNLDVIKNLNIKSLDFEIDFLQKSKGYELLNKIFYPVIVGIVIINVILFSLTKYEVVKYKKEYKNLKKINLNLKKKIEPVLKTEDILKKYREVNKEITMYSEKIFPFLDFFKTLSKVENLFVNNLYIRGDRLRFSGKTKSALKLIEILKKLKYLKDPKIVSNISRDSFGNERFQIEAKIVYGK